MNTMTNNLEGKPWFKQPWLWFVLSVPITSVILSSIMVTVAVVGKDSLVSDNYYKDGMGINQTIQQDQFADQLNLRPIINIDNSTITLALKTEHLKTENLRTDHLDNERFSNALKQPFLTLKLLHPTVSDKDLILKLLPTPSGLYIAELPMTLEGRRYLDLYAYDKSWRIREEVIFPIKQFELNLNN